MLSRRRLEVKAAVALEREWRGSVEGGEVNIGLFGGSFDPVHLGHLLAARAAVEELALTRLIFVPTAQSPFKPERALAQAGERLRMLRLASAGERTWEVDALEVERGGVSYTVETLRAYAERFPGSRLHYLIGADHVAQLPKWKQAPDLARLAEFVVVPRPGERPAEFPTPFRGRWLRGFPVEISATQIRARVREGKSIGPLVPGMVAEAISQSGLYLSG